MKTKYGKVKTETERAYVRRISLKLGKPMSGHSYCSTVPITEVITQQNIYHNHFNEIRLDMIMILELHMGVKLTDLPGKKALKMCIRVYGLELVRELTMFASGLAISHFCASRE